MGIVATAIKRTNIQTLQHPSRFRSLLMLMSESKGTQIKY